MPLDGKQIQAAGLVAQGNLTNDAIAAKVGCAPRTLDDWKAAEEFKQEVERIANDIRERVTKRGIGNKERRLRTLNTLLRRQTGFILARARMQEQQLQREAEDLEQRALAADAEREAAEEEHLATSLLYETTESKADQKKLRAKILGLQWQIKASRQDAAACRREAASLLSALPMVKTGMVSIELKSLHVGKDAYQVVHEFSNDKDASAEIRALMEQAAIETGQWKSKVSLENPDGSPLLSGLKIEFVNPAAKDEEPEGNG